jgi:hypothetical protein
MKRGGEGGVKQREKSNVAQDAEEMIASELLAGGQVKEAAMPVPVRKKQM